MEEKAHALESSEKECRPHAQRWCERRQAARTAQRWRKMHTRDEIDLDSVAYAPNHARADRDGEEATTPRAHEARAARPERAAEVDGRES